MSFEQERILARSGDELRVFMEITERSLLAHPHVLMSQVRAARNRGWQIALDDVGANPDSLAMLDLLTPDVVKLDLNLIRQTPLSEQARTLAAVMVYAERTGIAVQLVVDSGAAPGGYAGSRPARADAGSAHRRTHPVARCHSRTRSGLWW